MVVSGAAVVVATVVVAAVVVVVEYPLLAVGDLVVAVGVAFKLPLPKRPRGPKSPVCWAIL